MSAVGAADRAVSAGGNGDGASYVRRQVASSLCYVAVDNNVLL